MRRMTGLCAACLIALVSIANLSAEATESQLIDAVKAGNRDAVRALLKRPAEVNAPEPDGTTALHWAVRAEDAETVQLLLRAGANPKAANRHGVTPLLLAAINADAGMIETLIGAGADPNASLSEGQTVLMTAARTGNPAAVKALAAHGANVTAKERLVGETALIWAAAENHADVVNVLVELGAEIDGRSNILKFPRSEFGDGKSGRLTVLPRGGWTPLMYAARQNAMAAARALADAGADLNLTDPDGTTALAIAIINAHYDLAALLLEKAADPNIPDVTGMTALYAAVDMNTLGETPGRPAPRPSGSLDSLAIIERLLARGANPNAPLREPVLVRVHQEGDATLGAGATPLMRAARKADLAVMRLLLDKGADPRVVMNNQSTALMFVAGLGGLGRFGVYEQNRGTEEERIEAAKLMLARDADINAVNDAGQTALHIAAAEREDSFIKFLADRGARLDIKDKQGRTALDVALGVGVRSRGGAPAAARESTAALLRQLMGGAGSAAPAR